MYELIDKDGNVKGHYSKAEHAAKAAKMFWPEQEQDPDRKGFGWDVNRISSGLPAASISAHYS